MVIRALPMGSSRASRNRARGAQSWTAWGCGCGTTRDLPPDSVYRQLAKVGVPIKDAVRGSDQGAPCCEVQGELKPIAPPEQFRPDHEGWCSEDAELFGPLRLLAETRSPVRGLGLSHDVSTRETLLVEKLGDHVGVTDVAVVGEVRSVHGLHKPWSPVGLRSHKCDARCPCPISRERGWPLERPRRHARAARCDPRPRTSKCSRTRTRTRRGRHSRPAPAETASRSTNRAAGCHKL